MRDNTIKELDTTNSALRRGFLAFFSSGRYRQGESDSHRLDETTRYVLFNLFLITGFLLFTAFTVSIYLDPLTSVLLKTVDTSFLVFIVFLFFLARTKAPIIIPATLLVLIYAGFVCMITYTRDSGIASPLWSFILPLIAYFLLKDTLGGLISLAALAFMIFVFATESYYPTEFSTRVVILYLFISFFSLFSGRRLRYLTDSFANARNMLNRERAELTTMKDNLETGIFMLDANFEIQPLYSKYMSQVFKDEKLDYVSFPMLLANSLKAKDLELLKDFLEMILVSAFDKEMLQEVNPLQKFSYISKQGEEKVLSILFAQIERDDGEKVLLGTVRDITVETKLEEKLAAEEEFRKSEMVAMFEVMQVTPEVLNDFLDDLDYHFDIMNDILKDKSQNRETVYRELYQGIHAVKSNAAVIGLASAADRLHEFEQLLQDKQDNAQYDYETLLSVMFELERIMMIRDNLREVLERLQAFSTNTAKMHTSKDFFEQSIRRTIKKGQEVSLTEASLRVGRLDWDAIHNDYRRVIRDIVMQFTRNALAHAIESPAEREKNGKNREGIISLSIAKIDEIDGTQNIKIEFSDDGKGIDFDEVRKQVIEKDILPANADLSNNNTLIKALFSHGFSTTKNLSMQSGRGVGLSLVSDTVKKCKGTIKVQSKPKQGTKFTITIPYREVIG